MSQYRHAMISEHDLGSRVVVRYLLDPDDGGATLAGPRATEVLGTLEAIDPAGLVVRRRDGSVVTIRRASLVAAKVVPPRAVPRREMRLLEEAAALGWEPVEEHRLGGWRLRAAGGFTGRANSVLPLGNPGVPMPSAIDEVVRWYDARGLVPQFQVPLPLAGQVDRVLAQLGWPALKPTIVSTAPAEGLADRSGPPDGLDVALAAQPTSGWLAAFADGKELSASGQQVLTSSRSADLAFASIETAGTVVAIARGAVSADSSGRRWLGVTGLLVDPRWRQQGLATCLVIALARWASELGATEAYVQVLETNQAATAALGRLGFVEHHRYHYRVWPAHPPSGSGSVGSAVGLARQ